MLVLILERGVELAVPQNPKFLLEHFLAISRAIARQVDFQSVLSEISDEIHQFFEHDHMDICISLPHQPDFNISFEVGMSTKWGETSGNSHPILSSPIRELLLGRVPSYLTGDAWDDDRFHFEGAFDSPIFDAHLRSRIHVPLHVHGVVRGSLNISSHQINKYSNEDVEIAKLVGDLLAPYFNALIWGDQAENAAMAEGAARGREETLRRGSLRLTEGMENERKRLGMDLHDQTLADLTRISRHISRISRKDSPIASDITKLGIEINNCMSELRRIIEDTKPGVMDLFGFAQAVEAQLERSVAGITSPIKTEVRDSASSILDQSPEALRTTLFRIVQEAINNAVRHSSPQHVFLDIEKSEECLVISVIDDGSGAAVHSEDSPGGMDNMRVRAALISADLTVSSAEPGGGTRIAISIPLEEIPGNAEAAAEKSMEDATQ